MNCKYTFKMCGVSVCTFERGVQVNNPTLALLEEDH